jgi:hypothetical protein
MNLFKTKAVKLGLSAEAEDAKDTSKEKHCPETNSLKLLVRNKSY